MIELKQTSHKDNPIVYHIGRLVGRDILDKLTQRLLVDVVHDFLDIDDGISAEH